uniref:adenosine receptor A3 n=1 Tax=Centroberyx gerrardi TaxID=166262 RepID=UPI003AB06C6C
MQEAVKPLFAALMLLSGLASVSGNLLLLLVLLLNKDLRSETLGLTLSCSLSDLALGLCAVPFGAHNSLLRPDGFPSEGALCQGSGFLFLLLQTSSLHSLTWATVDKFTQIRLALSYRRLWTARRTQAVLVLVWSFCLLSAALPLLGFGSYSYSDRRFICCPGFTPDNKAFNALWMAAGVLAPVLTMCFLYGCIVYIARKQARRGTFMCNEQHCFYVPANSYFRSSMVMVATSVCLLVCWLPFSSLCLYETLSGRRAAALTSALCTWLLFSGSALNPWITCLTHSRYRLAVRRSFLRFLQVCRCYRKSRPQSPALHLDTANHISSKTPAEAEAAAAPQPPKSPPSQTSSSASIQPTQPPSSSSSSSSSPSPEQLMSSETEPDNRSASSSSSPHV